MPPVSLHRLQILAAALLFSSGGAAIKATSLTGWQVAGFRSGIAALALMIAMPTWRRWWRPRVLAAGVAYAATMVLYVTGNKLTTAANVIFLQGTAPMYLLLLGPWLLRESIRGRDLFAAAALAVGLLLFFVGAEQPLATAPNPLAGNILGACAGLTWALTILSLRWLARNGVRDGDDPAGAAVVAGNLIACAVCLPLAFPVLESRPVDWTIVGYLGVFQIGLAYVCMTRGVRRVPAFEASLLLLLEPVLNAIWAWLAHGERPGPWSLAGCALILAATMVLTLRRGRVLDGRVGRK